MGTMPIAWLIVILFGTVIIFLSLRMWVGLALGVAGIVGTVVLLGMPDLVSTSMYSTLSDYTLAAIPMFVFMGEIVLGGGLTTRMYSGVSKWTGVLPGGLTHSNIASCAIFGAVTSSTAATTAMMGTVAYPEQARRGYNKRLVAGSLAAGGTLGPLIPPSFLLIIYGALVGESVAKLWVGSVGPGVLLAVMYMAYIFIRFKLNPSLGPKRDSIGWSYLKHAVLALKDIWPMALLILIIFVGIYGGFTTPTEAGAISGFVALCLALALRGLTFSTLKEASLKALELSAFLFLIMVSAKILACAVSMLMIPQQLSELIAASGLSPMGVWGLVILMYVLLGCLMGGLAIFFLTIPVFYPLMMSAGFDPLWFGVAMAIALETSVLTPPVGGNLFIMQGVTKLPFMEVVKGTTPFFIIMMANLAVLTAFPQLATWLPSTMK